MFDYLIVAVLVLWSAIVVFKKVFPQTSASSISCIINPVSTLGLAAFGIMVEA